MSGTYHGIIDWDGSQDEEGHRTYNISLLVETSDTDDGPYTVGNTAGLPRVGSYWNPGNDVDIWARAWPTLTISPFQHRLGEKHNWWTVDMVFSTKPFQRCQDTRIENPLLEPQKVSGSFIKATKEAKWDINGRAITSSSWEYYSGREIEVDDNRTTVRIEQNVGALGLPTFSWMQNAVNGHSLWGLLPNTVKLSNVSWERKVFGTCGYYYTRILEFDIRYSGWYLTLQDKGFKALKSGVGVNPDPFDSDDFEHILDVYLNRTPVKMPLNGSGAVLNNGVNPVFFSWQVHPFANFFLLGIPSFF